ncbi:breast carcinoma amplified sequence 2-domain-containing protein [Coniella lustricola]|uniref:Breast carcinoma amplified sequence 2-domain-containing protein n=1 Tax=Coniella lustricola TaxID=2025994 RepID=A0A2T2ZRQ8_9PEZI|nr:breast carcinoma amplified sequence 2-domain-containing protein [Coniella lustricola]
MPSIMTVHDSLPYIDAEPTPAERAAAEALIAMERSSHRDDAHHALLPPPVQPAYTPLMASEMDRLAASQPALPPPTTNNTPYYHQQYQQQQQQQQSQQPPISQPQPLRAIDLSRYEAPALDPHNFPSNLSRDDLEPALSQAYTAMSYLTSRRQHLALLDTHGKNAWLVGNWQLESELKAVERQLAATRREIDLLTIQRQRMQNEVAAEVRGLDETWRRGVGRVLEAEVAAEGVRRERAGRTG